MERVRWGALTRGEPAKEKEREKKICGSQLGSKEPMNGSERSLSRRQMGELELAGRAKTQRPTQRRWVFAQQPSQEKKEGVYPLGRLLWNAITLLPIPKNKMLMSTTLFFSPKISTSPLSPRRLALPQHTPQRLRASRTTFRARVGVASVTSHARSVQVKA